MKRCGQVSIKFSPRDQNGQLSKFNSFPFKVVVSLARENGPISYLRFEPKRSAEIVTAIRPGRELSVCKEWARLKMEIWNGGSPKVTGAAIYAGIPYTVRVAIFGKLAL